MANDARVLAGKSATFRHVYACAIVKAAHGGAVSAACHLHTINDLKGRLKMLSTRQTSRARLASGIAAVALVTATGLGVTASGTQAAETIRTRVSQLGRASCRARVCQSVSISVVAVSTNKK